jgi:hypothetical protein
MESFFVTKSESGRERQRQRDIRGDRRRTHAAKATKVARAIQLGAAPATMAKMEAEKRETLKAKRRPITSAPKRSKESELVRL